MKDLIKEALIDAWDNLANRLPTHKNAPRSIDISDVIPKDLLQFMKDNDVPEDADFDGVDNGYDGWEPYRIELSWEIKIPTTNLDRLAFAKKHFTSAAFKRVYDLLMTNGYKRVGFSTALLKEFDDTTVYDMYCTNDWDRLVRYYSLPFNLVVSN